MIPCKSISLLMLTGLVLAVSTADAAPQSAKGSHASLTCNACHVDGKMQTPDMKTCQSCHGTYEALAARTTKLNPAFNPHYSHRGNENCTDCHAMHRPSQFICNDCHGFTGAGTQMK